MAGHHVRDPDAMTRAFTGAAFTTCPATAGRTTAALHRRTAAARLRSPRWLVRTAASPRSGGATLTGLPARWRVPRDGCAAPWPVLPHTPMLCAVGQLDQ